MLCISEFTVPPTLHLRGVRVVGVSQRGVTGSRLEVLMKHGPRSHDIKLYGDSRLLALQRALVADAWRPSFEEPLQSLAGLGRPELSS